MLPSMESASPTTRPMRWVRADQAAAYLDIGISTLYRYRAQGKLPPGTCRRLSHRLVLWDLEALDQFLEAQPGPTGPDAEVGSTGQEARAQAQSPGCSSR